VALPDGTRIALAGGTQLLLARGDARHVRLVRGSARFHVVHDAARPFEVALGDTDVRDLGTDFVLTRVAGRSEVAVVEGAVLYDPGGTALPLRAGDAIVDPDGPGPIQGSRAEPASMGDWADGSLSFREATMPTVADRLSRATGLTVTADPALGGRRFTGRIALGGGLPAVRERVVALVDVAVRPTPDGWTLVRGDRAR
jgi:transmembrane sensor